MYCLWYCRYHTAVIEELDEEEGTPEQEEAVAHERAKAWEEAALSLVSAAAECSDGRRALHVRHPAAVAGAPAGHPGPVPVCAQQASSRPNLCSGGMQMPSLQCLPVQLPFTAARAPCLPACRRLLRPRGGLLA